VRNKDKFLFVKLELLFMGNVFIKQPNKHGIAMSHAESYESRQMLKSREHETNHEPLLIVLKFRNVLPVNTEMIMGLFN
jgi:hypothetical protein